MAGRFNRVFDALYFFHVVRLLLGVVPDDIARARTAVGLGGLHYVLFKLLYVFCNILLGVQRFHGLEIDARTGRA